MSNQKVNNRFLFFFTLFLIAVAGGWQFIRPHVLDDSSSADEIAIIEDAEKTDNSEIDLVIPETDIPITDSDIYGDFFGDGSDDISKDKDNLPD